MTLNQIIYIMLLVIFVGIMMLVGIQIYRHQAYMSNQKSLEMDMSHYCAQIFVYWKTPFVGGGAGQNLSLIRKAALAEYVGFAHVVDPSKKADYYSIFTINGEIRLMQVSTNTIVLKGLGRTMEKGKFPMIQNTVNLYTFVINTTINSAKDFD
jgi:hypothetical protein